MAELVVALDAPGAKEAMRYVDELAGIVSWLKIGLELFIAEGPGLITRIKNRGFKIFLDLKFYDIPNTVAGAVKSASGLGVDMLTLHLQGGGRMCEAALNARGSQASPLLLGVTVLTSFGEGEVPGIREDIAAYAAYLAKCASLWGLNGLVCSGFETAAIKRGFPNLLCLCPGIRPQKIAGDDQRRSMTPEEAVSAGADFLVVGRPILKSADPAGAARQILERMN